MCSGFLYFACSLISLSSWPFLWFLIGRLIHILFLSLVVNFLIFQITIFLKRKGVRIYRQTQLCIRWYAIYYT